MIDLDFFDICDIFCLVVNIEVLFLAICGQLLLLQRPFSLPLRRFVGTSSRVRIELVVIFFGFVVESDCDFRLWLFDRLRLGLDLCLLLVRLSLPISHSKVELWLLLLSLDDCGLFFRNFQRVFGL